AQRLGVLAAELEDVPHLHAAGQTQRAGAVGRGVPVAHLCGLDGAVGREVPAEHEVVDVLVLLPGARDPRGAGDDARIDQVADPGGGLEPEALGAEDRKSTRLNSSHVSISYAVFCLKKYTSPRSRRRSTSSLITGSGPRCSAEKR